MAELTLLEQLLAPVSPRLFFNEHWERTHLLVSRESPEHYAGILTLADIDDLLRSHRLPASLAKAVKDGRGWPGADGEALAAAEAGPYLDHARLYDAYARDGASIVIDGAHHVGGPLNRFCACLESELGFRVQANLYVTPPDARGLRPHYDTHDVMVLQISGSKAWRLFGHCDQRLPVDRTRGAERAYADDQAEHRLTLHPGDLLYLPRGLVHDASSGDAPSVHVALGLRPDLALDLVREWAQTAAERVFFRQALPHPASTPEERRTFEDGFARELEALMAEVPVSGLMAQRRARFVGEQLREREGQFADLLRLQELGPESVLVKRPGLDYVLDHQHDEIRLRFGVHAVSVPTFLRAAMDVIIQGRPFRVRALPGLMTEQVRKDLIRELVITGFLRIEHV